MGQFLPIIKSSCQPCTTCGQQPKGRPAPNPEKTFGRARIMPDGKIVYPKKGWEPPPAIEGYQRDKGNPWAFIPLWPACQHRARTLQMKKCGSYNVLMVCGCDGCPLKQQIVKLTDCQGCPHQKP